MRAPGIPALVCACALTGVGACVVAVDLQAEAADTPLTCPAGERRDPASGRCAPCQVDDPATVRCPCGATWESAAFPYCEGAAVAHQCRPCQGDVTACVGYGSDGSVGDCGLFLACCAQLAATPGATPCCPNGDPADDLVQCVSDPATGKNFHQCGRLCECEGGACPNGEVDCLGWQDCIAGRCTPACEPNTTYCCVSCGCECRDVQ